MFLLSSIFRGLEFWSVNHTSMYGNFKWKVFKNIKFLGGISNNQPNDVIWINMHKTLTHNHCVTILQGTNTTSVIWKWQIFSRFLSLVILPLVLPSNFIVSDVKSLRYYPVLISNVIPSLTLFAYILIEGLSVFSPYVFKIYSK